MVKIVFDTVFEYRDWITQVRDVVEAIHKGVSTHCDVVELARGQTPQAGTGEQEGQSNDG